MADSWLSHKALRIMKGIGKYPTDTNSAENNPVVVDLMSGVITLDTDGWSPNITTVKNGGVWTESPTTDGRSLIAAAAGNVTEKMTLNITDKAYLSVMKALESLGFMAASCRNFWQTQTQIDPVYLMWAAGCNTPPLPQYAILYNIELVPDYLDSPNQPTIRVAMTLEREPYWRGIPPGMNPKMWTFYVNGQQIGLGTKVLADTTLVSGSDHLITQTIQNKFEWSPTAFGLQTTPLSQNYIDIAASQVPGDAPALVEMSVIADTAIVSNIYISRASKPQSKIGHDGITRYNSYILNGGDAEVFGGAAKVNIGSAGGVRSNSSSTIFYDVERTVTGIDGSYVTIARWGDTTSLIKLDRQLFRGTFAIFARCTNASATPTLADMKIQVIIEEYEGNTASPYFIATYTSPEVNPPFSSATAPKLVYIGTVTLPFESKSVQSPLGYGTQITESLSNFRVTLQQQVLVATALRQIRFIDLVFMPLDEAFSQVNMVFGSTSSSSVVLLDDTGYLSRGALNTNGVAYATSAVSGGVSEQVLGTDLTLLPRTDQRLYFIEDCYISGSNIPSRPDVSMVVRLNIVPRWSGIRDQ